MVSPLGFLTCALVSPREFHSAGGTPQPTSEALGMWRSCGESCVIGVAAAGKAPGDGKSGDFRGSSMGNHGKT